MKMELKVNKMFGCFTKRLLPLALFLFFTSGISFLCAQETEVLFQFRDAEGDSNSYISTVNEQVFLNGVLTHKAEIINRISSTVIDVQNDGAQINASYMTTENTVMAGFGNKLSWGDENFSSFIRSKNGMIDIDDKTLYPTVRNVPVFPDYPVKKGEGWQAEGREVHDLRSLSHTPDLTIIPFKANYVYKGDITKDGTLFNIIEVSYSFNFRNDVEEILNGNELLSSSGYSKQTLYWDNHRGILDHYDEEFQIKVQDVRRNTYVFQGSANAIVTEYKSLNDDDNVRRLQKSVDDLQLENVLIKKGDKGLTISLENIQFEPDSSVLLAEEKLKLEKIAAILKNFSNDLLITGHCADRGTQAAQQRISEERADAVANYLEKIGVRDEYHIFTQGKGASEPVAPNVTEEGRRKNRRVEIIIMD